MKRKPLITAIGIVLVAVLIIIGVWFYKNESQTLANQGVSQEEETALQEATGKTLPFELVFQDESGKPVSLSEYKGKVTVINFWATWCPICINEMKDFYPLYQKYQNDPSVQFIFADLLDNRQETKEKVAEFLKKNNYDLPVLYDEGTQNFAKLGLTGVPDTLVINKKGEVAPLGVNPDNKPYYIRPGAMPADVLESIIKREVARK